MKRRNSQALISSATLLATLVGCAEPTGAKPEITKIDQEIIGGVPAYSASLNAIGALTYHITLVDEYTGEKTLEYYPLCTGSLISAQTILTAKHCTEGFEDPSVYGLPEGSRLFFHFGPDAQKPVRAVEIVAVERAPGDEGGFIGRGRDVATFHLLEKVTDIAPLTLGTIEKNQLNKKFAVVGYGVQDNTGKSGTRYAGTETLTGLSGQVFQLMFGSFEAFYEWYEWVLSESFDSQEKGGVHRTLLGKRASDTGAGDTDTGDAGISDEDAGTDEDSDSDAGTTDEDDLEAALRAIYDESYLLEGYEAYTSRMADDAQSCYGDSGGPLVRNVNGKMRIFGVTSGGLYSKELVCDYGGIYATFGKDVMDFLNKSKKWVDPCKGVSTEGVCEGDVAKRCTTVAEGPRRVTRTNCGLLAQTCGIDEAGVAGCVDR